MVSAFSAGIELCPRGDSQAVPDQQATIHRDNSGHLKGLIIDEDECGVFRCDQVKDHLITVRLAGFAVPRNMKGCSTDAAGGTELRKAREGYRPQPRGRKQAGRLLPTPRRSFRPP